MWLPLLCAQCIQADRQSRECTVFVTANDTGIYQITCRFGHCTDVVLVATRHEQLFEIGLSAISDQYFREAVSSFAAALERFYEFVTAVLAEGSGVEIEAFNATWKHLSKQSERQLGAFCAAFLMSEKQAPLTLPQKATEFRNDVVHKGKVPTRDEALKFGDDVLHVIRQTLKVLRPRHVEVIQRHSMKPHLEALDSPSLRGKSVTRHHLAWTLRNLEVEDIEGRDTNHYVYCLQTRHGVLR
jgi:hypothetical protein